MSRPSGRYSMEVEDIDLDLLPPPPPPPFPPPPQAQVPSRRSSQSSQPHPHANTGDDSRGRGRERRKERSSYDKNMATNTTSALSPPSWEVPPALPVNHSADLGRRRGADVQRSSNSQHEYEYETYIESKGQNGHDIHARRNREEPHHSQQEKLANGHHQRTASRGREYASIPSPPTSDTAKDVNMSNWFPSMVGMPKQLQLAWEQLRDTAIRVQAESERVKQREIEANKPLHAEKRRLREELDAEKKRLREDFELQRTRLQEDMSIERERLRKEADKQAAEQKAIEEERSRLSDLAASLEEKLESMRQQEISMHQQHAQKMEQILALMMQQQTFRSRSPSPRHRRAEGSSTHTHAHVCTHACTHGTDTAYIDGEREQGDIRSSQDDQEFSQNIQGTGENGVRAPAKVTVLGAGVMRRSELNLGTGGRRNSLIAANRLAAAYQIAASAAQAAKGGVQIHRKGEDINRRSDVQIQRKDELLVSQRDPVPARRPWRPCNLR